MKVVFTDCVFLSPKSNFSSNESFNVCAKNSNKNKPQKLGQRCDSGLISLIGGLISLISGLIGLISGLIGGLIHGLISLIGLISGLIGGLISLIGGLISLFCGLLSQFSQFNFGS